MDANDFSLCRYEIANGEAGWDDAERQIKRNTGGPGKSTTVSVKSAKASGQAKRKAGEALEEAQKEAAGGGGGSGGGEGKKSKKGKKSR